MRGDISRRGGGEEAAAAAHWKGDALHWEILRYLPAWDQSAYRQPYDWPACLPPTHRPVYFCSSCSSFFSSLLLLLFSPQLIQDVNYCRSWPASLPLEEVLSSLFPLHYAPRKDTAPLAGDGRKKFGFLTMSDTPYQRCNTTFAIQCMVSRVTCSVSPDEQCQPRHQGRRPNFALPCLFRCHGHHFLQQLLARSDFFRA